MHLYSLCQTWLNLKTDTVSETENRTSCLTTVSQTITVSSCQSDISNREVPPPPPRPRGAELLKGALILGGTFFTSFVPSH